MSRSTTGDRVFLDATVLFSAAYLSDNLLRHLWELPDTQIITSEYAVREAQHRLPAARHRGFDALIRATPVDVGPSIGSAPLPLELVLPPKDVPIYTAARFSDATHLLTGD